MGGVVKLGYKGLTLNFLGATNNWATMNRLPVWPSPLEYRIENQRYFGDLTYSKQISSSWTSSVSATYNSFYYRAYNASKADDYLRRGSNDVLIELTNYLKPLPNLNLVVGGLLNKQSGRGIDNTFSPTGAPFNIDATPNPDPWSTVPSYDYTWYAAYAQSDYSPLKQVKLIAGVQMNKIDGLQANYSPRFGAIFSANDNLGLKLLYGNAFRSPAAFERFGQSPNTVLGSSSLTPERITTMESQVFYNTTKISVAATYFFNHDDNNIGRQNITQTINGVTYTQQYINTGYINVSGVEFEGKCNLSNFIIQGSGTYQSSVDNLNQKNYTGVPQVMAKVGLTYNWKKMGSLAFWNSYYGAASDYFNHGANGVVLTKMANPSADAYNYASANLRVQLREIIRAFPDVTFNLLVTNVFDANIFYPELARRNINTLPGRPGRAVYASFSIKIR
jgi:outer membrane receptor for ferrienterochelin and colicins